MTFFAAAGITAALITLMAALAIGYDSECVHMRRLLAGAWCGVYLGFCGSCATITYLVSADTPPLAQVYGVNAFIVSAFIGGMQVITKIYDRRTAK